MSIAIALFAKTPGKSPIKTRLARDIGQLNAELFYDLCLACNRELMAQLHANDRYDIKAYWALAEQEAALMPCWQDFPALWTGEGGLGQRMHRIYDHLLQRHKAVIIMGTDIPQLSVLELENALHALSWKDKKCLIGPAEDGGFYLFASSQPVPKNVWTSVPYSTAETLTVFKNNLTSVNIDIAWLTPKRDVDQITDLEALAKTLAGLKTPLPTQETLRAWINTSILPQSKTAERASTFEQK